MATLRTAGPSISSIFRLASQQATARSSTRCAHCLRAQRCPFSSFRPALQSSKRPLMTETVRPQTLVEPEMPPPPRNEGVPETSIAGPSGGQQQQSWPQKAPWERKASGVGSGIGGASEREGEAQKSKPTFANPAPNSAETTAAPTPSPQKAAAPKKSKLRPRKAPINLTPTAVTQLRELFDSPDHKMIRVGVKNRGCSGLAYHLEYVDKPGSFDETVEQDGVKVLIDSKALFSIIGSEMDFVQDKLQERFVFRNPNITEQCGCGESFSIS